MTSLGQRLLECQIMETSVRENLLLSRLDKIGDLFLLLQLLVSVRVELSGKQQSTKAN